MPGVGIPGTFFQDANNATWIGGDYTLNPGFVETEGVTVVEGNLAQNNGGWLGVGVVGVGSGIVPPADGLMLAVGGNVTVPAPGSLQIGAQMGADMINGKADIGGSASGTIYSATGNPSDIQANLGAAAIAPWAGFGAELTATSDALSALPTTGSFSAGTFTVTDASAPLQVFTITAAELASTGGAMDFRGLPIAPDGAPVPVVINVTGTSAVLNQNYVTFDGVRVDDFSGNPSGYGAAASGLLWNFPDATTLDVPGTSQVMGSIVAPRATTTTVTASTNGRFYINGDVTRAGNGGEHHNYPWRGGYGFGCTPDDSTGTFRLSKAIDADPAGLVPPTTAFTVLVTACRPELDGAVCTPLSHSEDGVALPTTLTILADGTVVAGPEFQIGDRVTFQEAPPGNIPGVEWGNVTFTPGNTIVIGPGNLGQLVTVTNQATQPAAGPATFRIHKAITPVDLANDMATADFTVGFSVCRPLDPPPAAPLDACLPVVLDTVGNPLPANLTLRGDGTVVNGPPLQSGDRVTFWEVEPLPNTPSGWHWGDVTITPSTVVLDGSATSPVEVTVTNSGLLGIDAGDPTVDVPFCISKELSDPDSLVAAGTSFTLSFTVVDINGRPVTTYASGDPLPASITLTSGTSWCSSPEALHHGDRVTVTELSPAPQEGLTWGDAEVVPSTLLLDAANAADMTIRVTNTAAAIAPATWQIHKDLTGAGAVVDPNATFTVHYNACHPVPVTNPLVAACDPDISPAGTGTVTINAKGDIVTGPAGLHNGDRVSFVEDTPPPGAGYTWGDVTITPTTLVLDSAHPVVVEVTNQALSNIVIAPATVDASFRIQKVMQGNGVSLVPPKTQFRVNYTVVDLNGQPVTTDANGAPLPGFLTITADGAIIDGPTLHHRDTVTFAEVTPPAIPGVTWGTIEISPTTLLLGAADPVTTVTVRNTASTLTSSTGGSVAPSGPTVAMTLLLGLGGACLGLAAAGGRRRRIVR